MLERDINRRDDARRTRNERVRPCTRGSPRPTLTRFDTGPTIGWFATEIDFIRRATGERRVRTMLIEPIDVEIEFPTEVTASYWHRHLSSEFRFERAEESLDDGNAPVFAHRAVT